MTARELHPCRCGAPGAHPAGTVDLCPICFDRLLGDVRARHVAEIGSVGFGRQDGPVRPDWGPGWAELRCTVCDATWTGIVGEDCGYCIRFLEIAQDAQRAVLLRPELPDEPTRRADALRTWAHRLRDAVAADLVTDWEARAAWDRQVRRHAA